VQRLRLIDNPASPGRCQVRRPVLAAEIGRAGPGPPAEGARLARPADRQRDGGAYDVVVGAIDSTRLPFLPGSIPPSGGDGGGGGEDQDAGTGDGQDTPNKRGGHGGAGAVSGRKGSVS
jgi:hypothetical protein